MKTLGHNPSGKPYHGSSAPFRIQEFIEMRDSICHGSRNFADAYALRTLFKHLSANRLCISLPQRGKLPYRQLDFADTFQRLLATVPQKDYLISYLEFFFRCYNDQNMYPERVIVSKCTFSKKKNRNNLQMALKDIAITCKRDMMKVLQVLQSTPSVLTPEEEEILGKYEDISRAVHVLDILFTGMYILPLPKTLSQEVFEEAEREDSRIANYYQRNASGYQRKQIHSSQNARKSKMPALYFVNERAIAVIVLRGWMQ